MTLIKRPRAWLFAALTVVGCGASDSGTASAGTGAAGKSSATGAAGKVAAASGAGASARAGTGAAGETKSAGTRAEAGRTSQVDAGTMASAACTSEPEHSGEGTFYTFADGSGNCSFDATPNDLMVGAMNATDYADSAVCGACVHIVGPNGEVTVRTVDQCPECAKGDIDLSPEAFELIAERSAGRVPIRWTYVACAGSSPIVYHFKQGSNQWWTAVQIRNTRYRVAKLEYEQSGDFIAVPRESYNYFVEANGMGPGPYTFRVTDVYGSTVVERGVVFKEASDVMGTQQFEVCASP